MIRIEKLHMNTNGNYHTIGSVHCIIMSFLMLIVIEMLFVVRFASQRENPYEIRCCDINKENVQMKHYFYM
jgi:hypothetical protein